jgi:hypothetical protein
MFKKLHPACVQECQRQCVTKYRRGGELLGFALLLLALAECKGSILLQNLPHAEEALIIWQMWNLVGPDLHGYSGEEKNHLLFFLFLLLYHDFAQFMCNTPTNALFFLHVYWLVYYK